MHNIACVQGQGQCFVCKGNVRQCRNMFVCVCVRKYLCVRVFVLIRFRGHTLAPGAAAENVGCDGDALTVRRRQHSKGCRVLLLQLQQGSWSGGGFGRRDGRRNGGWMRHLHHQWDHQRKGRCRLLFSIPLWIDLSIRSWIYHFIHVDCPYIVLFISVHPFTIHPSLNSFL